MQCVRHWHWPSQNPQSRIGMANFFCKGLPCHFLLQYFFVYFSWQTLVSCTHRSLFLAWQKYSKSFQSWENRISITRSEPPWFYGLPTTLPMFRGWNRITSRGQDAPLATRGVRWNRLLYIYIFSTNCVKTFALRTKIWTTQRKGKKGEGSLIMGHWSLQ